MRAWLQLVFPYGVLFALLAGAALMFGADTPMVTWFFAGLILLLTGTGLMISRTRLPWGIWPVAVAIAAMALYDIFQGRFAIAAPDYGAMAAGLGVFLLARAGAMKPRRLVRLWTMMLLTLLIIAAWAFTDFVLHPDTIHGQLRPYHLDRLSAAFLSANTAGTFFGITVLASLAPLLHTLKQTGAGHPVAIAEDLFRRALPALLTFLVALVCLFLTASRAAIAFTALSIVLLVIWETLAGRRDAERPRWQMPVVILGGLGFAAVFFWIISGDVAGARFADLEDGTNTRQVMFTAYWQAALEKPLTGHGFGSFPYVTNSVMTAENAHILLQQGAAHNIFLQWFLQEGLAGLILLCGLIGLVTAALLRGLRAMQHYKVYMRTILVLSFFTGLHSMVDYAVEIPGFFWWWVLLLGFGAGLGSQAAAKKNRKPDRAWSE